MANFTELARKIDKIKISSKVKNPTFVLRNVADIKKDVESILKKGSFLRLDARRTHDFENDFEVSTRKGCLCALCDNAHSYKNAYINKDKSDPIGSFLLCNECDELYKKE